MNPDTVSYRLIDAQVGLAATVAPADKLNLLCAEICALLVVVGRFRGYKIPELFLTPPALQLRQAALYLRPRYRIEYLPA